MEISNTIVCQNRTRVLLYVLITICHKHFKEWKAALQNVYDRHQELLYRYEISIYPVAMDFPLFSQTCSFLSITNRLLMKLIIWIIRRSYYKKQELLNLYEQVRSPTSTWFHPRAGEFIHACWWCSCFWSFFAFCAVFSLFVLVLCNVYSTTCVSTWSILNFHFFL